MAVGSLSVQYTEMTLPANGSRTYLNEVTHNNIDYANLSLTHNSGAFDIRLIQQDGKTYIRVFTNQGIIGETTPNTDTITLTGTDGQGNVSTSVIPVTQSIEDGEFFSDPNGDSSNPITISWEGETKTFTLINKATLDSPDFTEYHLTEVTRVSWYKNGVESDLPYTTEWVNGKIQVTVTFPRNNTYTTTNANLHIAAKDNFVPSSTVYMWPSCVLEVEGVPAGSIVFDDSEKWVNSQSWDGRTFYGSSRFTATAVDLNTLAVSVSGDSILNSIHLGSTNSYRYVWYYVNPNNTEQELTATVTVTATDYGGTVRSGQITLKQYKASDGWYFHITSPTTSTSNRVEIGYNEDLPITFVAKNATQIDLYRVGDSTYISSLEYENVSGNQYTGTIFFDDNNTTSKRTNKIAFSVSYQQLGYDSNTNSIYFTQLTRPGYIRFIEDSITVPKSPNYRHKDAQFVYDMIDGSLTPSITGDITGTFAFRDYDNGHYLVFTPDENETENTLTGTITLSGVDTNGTAVSDSYTVTQKPYNPYLKFVPFSEDTVNILYNETSTTFQAECQGIISLDEVYVYDSYFSNAFKDYYRSGSIIKIDNTHYTIVVNTYSNNTHTPSDRGVVTATPTTEFGKNDWDNGHILGNESFRWVRKCGIPGIINLSPSARNVDGEAGSTYFTYSIDSYMTQPISITHSGDMDITNFAIDGSRINVEYGENRTTADKVETITVSGTDYQGLIITRTATITQQPLSFIEFVDDEKTIGPTESTVTFEINDLNVSNITVSYTNTFITNYTLTERTGGHLLTVYTADNTQYVVKQSTITIIGTGTKGETLIDTVLLKKNGPDGSITLNPDAKTFTKTASEFTVGMTLLGVSANTISGILSGDVTSDGWTITSNSLTFRFRTNESEDTIYGTLTLNGTDYKGLAISATLSLTQLPYDSIISITPDSRELDYGENTATYSVEILNTDNIQVNTSGDTSFITNTTLSNGTLTVTTADFQAMVIKNATITISGMGIMGEVSDSVTLTKYGPDGTITANPSSLLLPKSARSTNIAITKAGIPGNLTVTSSGTVSFSSLTLNGSTLTVYSNENTTQGDLTGTITITGIDYKGNTITTNIPVTQYPYDSYIRLTPATRTVDKNGGTTTYSVETDSMDTTTLRANYSGSSVSNVTLVGNTVSVSYTASTIVANKVNTIYVTGTDIYGNSVRGDAELVQTGVDPTITVSTLNIGWDEGTATAFVATNGVGNISVSFSGDVNITDYSITPTSGGYNITIITPDNPTNAVYNSVATVTGTVTEGQYEGQTRTTTFNVNKYGKEGVVTIEPNAKTVRKVGATVEFDVSLINMDLSTVTASTGTFNSDKTKLTVTVGQNPNSSDRTINVTISGTDTNGDAKSATAVITQYGVDPYISITPASRIIGSTVSSTTFGVSTYKVTGIEVEVEGTINITDYQLSGNTLTITSTDNTDQLQKTALIVISGTDDLGDPIEARATLIKAGRGGGIVVNGDYVIPSNAGSLAIEYGLEDIDPDTIVVSTSGDINVTGIVVDRENRVAVISYGANSSANTKTGKIFINGLGDDGLTKLSMIDLSQLGNAYQITINPSVANVAYSSTSSSATVSSTGIASTTFGYSGSLEPSSCTFTKDASNSGTINATYSANSSDEYKRLYMTINGITTGGSNVTASAIINQGIDPSSGAYIFLLQPASQSVKVVEAAQTTVSYSINSIKGYDEVDYSITGFILSGRWGTRPYADGKRVVVPLNTRSEEREVKVIYTQDISLNTLTPRIIQQEGVEPDVNPIWKEFSTSANVNDFVEYHIKLGSDIIYAGKAYKYPDASKVTWSINDAVSNYLGNGLSFVEGIQQIPDYSKDFYMEDNRGNKYVETFYNSWAYDDTDYWLSDPIDYRVDPRQWLPVSFLSTNYDTITVGGRVYAALKENDGWTVMTHLSNFLVDCDSGFQVIGAESDRLTYRVAKGDYVLYYSNAYGGWDSLLCNGTSKKTDNIEHLTYRRKSRNQTDFSKVNYQNNVTPTWSLKTGITVDGQKMYHLLESTMVYLHNLETNEIVPVVITNSNCEYLSYTNNGKKPYFYDITVEESNQKLRK